VRSIVIGGGGDGGGDGPKHDDEDDCPTTRSVICGLYILQQWSPIVCRVTSVRQVKWRAQRSRRSSKHLLILQQWSPIVCRVASVRQVEWRAQRSSRHLRITTIVTDSLPGHNRPTGQVYTWRAHRSSRNPHPGVNLKHDERSTPG